MAKVFNDASFSSVHPGAQNIIFFEAYNILLYQL